MQIRESGQLNAYRNIQRAQIENDFQRSQTAQGLDKQGIEEKVQFSGSGLQRARLVSTLRQEAASLPDLREEKLAEVRERMALGHYDGPAFSDELAGKLEESGLIDLARQAARSEAVGPNPENYRPDLMQDVDQKLDAGFYTGEQVMDFVAERLIDLYRI